MTVALNFLEESEIHPAFSSTVLFLGMVLFYTGILLNGRLNEEQYRYPKVFWLIHVAVLALGLAVCLLIGSAEAAVASSAVASTALAANHFSFYRKGIGTKKQGV